MEPRIIIENFNFNHGETISLQSNSITVFVGANNVGKTAALKNLYNLSHNGGHNVTHKVIESAKLKKVGSREDFVEYMKKTNFTTENTPKYNFNIAGRTYDIDSIGDTWLNNAPENFGNYFIKFLMTENRIKHSDSIQTIDFYQQIPGHPIHEMYLSEELELEISKLFRQAYNADLVVERTAGQKIHLKVGDRPVLNINESHFNKSYTEKIRSLNFLKDQGDGMRSFTSILLELISKNQFSMLIDEPEAFLHPPQARFLGRLIGKQFTDRQIFISTHSSDFIKGILESNNPNLNLVRIIRNEEKNSSCQLNEDNLKEIWKDPILRHSPILDGLFHEGVIICEGDGDCRFFSTLLDSQFENDSRYHRISDTLFIPSHGKAKMPSIVKALKKVSVPTFTICDFDILNNISPLRELVEAHDGDWSIIESKWKILYNQINQIKSQLNKEETKKAIIESLENIQTENLSTKEIDKIKAILKSSTAWSFAKKSGLSFIPAGNAHTACTDVISYLNTIGIFPLLVGELESFDKNIGGTKSKWLEEVMKKDLKNPNVLPEAKTFLQNLIDRIFR